jgi:hypothetical protein
MRTPRNLLLRGLGALVLPGALALLYAQASACGPPCTGTERVYDQGIRTNDGGTLVWESSPIDGPFLPFEGGSTYHLQHKLGVRPYDYSITLSFSERPEVNGNGGEAPSAGNLALVLRTSDDEIVVKSDTCASYFIRVVVRAHPPSSTDAGVDAAFDSSPDVSPDVASDSADGADASD